VVVVQVWVVVSQSEMTQGSVDVGQSDAIVHACAVVVVVVLVELVVLVEVVVEVEVVVATVVVVAPPEPPPPFSTALGSIRTRSSQPAVSASARAAKERRKRLITSSSEAGKGAEARRTGRQSSHPAASLGKNERPPPRGHARYQGSVRLAPFRFA
jgi:hypothetical protein